jgi:hypothetical protein
MSEQLSAEAFSQRMDRIVERLFARLSAKYGRAFIAKYEGVDAAAVRADWARELRGYNDPRGGEIIAWALDHLPESVPNSIQFRNLCRQASINRHEALPAPQGKPLTEEQGAKLRTTIAAFGAPKAVGKNLEWADRIMQRVQEGRSPSVCARQMAMHALGLRV